MDNITDPYTRWSRAEEHHGAQDHLPARAEDLDGEGQDRDPYRIVLFDDLRSLLCDIRSIHGRQNLVFAALRLLGLWPNVSISTFDVPWHTTSDSTFAVSSADMFGSQDSQPRASPWEIDSIPEPIKAASVNTPVKCWASDLKTMFAEDWFTDLDGNDVKLLDVEIIRYVPSCATKRCVMLT